MMTIEELELIIGDTLLVERLMAAKHSREDTDKVEAAYIAVFKKRVNRTCNNCMADAFMELKFFYKKDKIQMEKQLKCRYRLRTGVVLSLDMGKGIVNYTNSNLTDEVAEFCLSTYPDSASRFEIIPTQEEVIEGEKGDNTANEEEGVLIVPMEGITPAEAEKEVQEEVIEGENNEEVAEEEEIKPVINMRKKR